MVDTLERVETDQEKLLNRQIDTLELQIDDNAPSNVLDKLVHEVEALLAKVPSSSPLAGRLMDIARKAEKEKEEAQAEEAKEASETMATVAAAGGLIAASAAEIAFSQGMFDNFMSPGEQQFFNSLQDPQRLVMLDRNGQIIANPGGELRIETIDGSKAQADFSLLVYHSRDKAEQEKIGELPVEMQGVDKLHDALARMEGLRMNQRMEAGISPEEAHAECRQDFARAHEQADSFFAVDTTAKALKAAAGANPMIAMNAKIAELAAKYHQDKLGQDLTKVVDDLTKDTDGQHERAEGRSHTQGRDTLVRLEVADVAEHSAPLPINAPTNSSGHSR